jgi:hypothetical protein
MRGARILVAAVATTIAVAGCRPSAVVSPSPSPSPTPIPSPNADEAYLISGVRSDAAIDCVPIRQVLPSGGVASIECAPDTDVVDRFRVTLFSSTKDVLSLYLAEMSAHGVALNSGTCFDGSGESTYFPGPDDYTVPHRNGCFVSDVAHYRAILDYLTDDGAVHAYIEIVGKNAQVSRDLDTFAWLGNEDLPGAPTLWTSPP